MEKNANTGLFVFCFLAFFFALPPVYSQEGYQDNVPVSFRERQAEVRPGQLVSTVVRIINPTRRAGEFTLRLEPPSGWQIVGIRERTFSMQMNDTLFFPVRVIARPQIQDPQPQLITVSLVQQRNVIASESWIISPVLRSNWNASLSRTNIILPEHTNEASFTIDIVNTGDITEYYNLVAEPSPGILMLNENRQIIHEEFSKRFSLAPMQDTVLTITILYDASAITETTQLTSRQAADPRVRFNMTSEPVVAVGGRWSGSVNIRKLGSKWIANPRPYYSIPLTVEFNAFDIISENTYGDIYLYGIHNFNPYTTLSYFFQANFISNYLNPESFLGQYLNINFQSRYFGVQLGNVSLGTPGYSLSGDGARVYGRYGEHQVHGGYVASPGLFDTLKFREGWSAGYDYLGQNLRGSAFFSQSQNQAQRTEDQVMGGEVSYRFPYSQFLRIAFNLTDQLHQWNPDSVFETAGVGYSFNYSGSFLNDLSVGGMYYKSSAANLIRRGTESYSARASWRFDRRNSLSANFSRQTSNPEFYFRGQLRELNQERGRESYRLVYQYSGDDVSIRFAPTYFDSFDQFLNYSRSGADIDFRLLNRGDFRFFAGSYAGYTFVSDTLFDPFFVANIRANLRYLQYNLSLRYYYGPYFSNELRRFIDRGSTFNRFATNFFFDNYFAGNSLFFRFSFLYNYTTYNNQSSVSVRPELFYFVNSGLRFGIYGRFFGMSAEYEDRMGIIDLGDDLSTYQHSRYEFGFSIKQDLNIPVSGKRFYDLTVVVYRDISGTGSKERSDPGVHEIWTRLQYIDPGDGNAFGALNPLSTFEAITDRDGRALFTNIPPGSYLLTLVPVAQAGSRFEARTYEVMVSDDRTLYLSIDRGARVAGSIIIERDDYTQAEYFPVNNIRITATNLEGQTFTTLTNNNGQYSLFLQKGSYTISVNENIFREIFNLQANNIPIEVVHEHEVITVNFIARERARQIRIQRPGEDNNNQQQD